MGLPLMLLNISLKEWKERDMRCHICDSILEPQEIKLKDGKIEPCFECKFHIYNNVDSLSSTDPHTFTWDRSQDSYEDFGNE